MSDGSGTTPEVTTPAYVGKPIGLSNLTWFPMLTDTETETTYDDPEKLARAIQAVLTPQFAEGLLESDDGIEDEISQVTAITVRIDANQLTEEMRGSLLGHDVDDQGGMTISGTDTPQLGALAFRALLSKQTGDNQYVYVVLYAGRFKEFAETFETKKRGQITYQTHTGIEGTFYPRMSDGAIQYRMRENDQNSAVIAEWFNSPQATTPGT